jgi:hypothetical protein
MVHPIRFAAVLGLLAAAPAAFAEEHGFTRSPPVVDEGRPAPVPEGSGAAPVAVTVEDGAATAPVVLAPGEAGGEYRAPVQGEGEPR